MISLLVSSFGYTLEHHFCNHCDEGFETRWFLIPEKPEAEHDCSCEHVELEASCNCDINQSKHTEHFEAKIISTIPQNNTEELIQLVHSIVFTSIDIENTTFWTKEASSALIVPFITRPNPIPINIINCCFLI